MKIKCKFGVPHHGWLPVKVTVGDFYLEMEASDVPVNPINILISSLTRTLSGFESEVWWHLEPASYYFSFASEGEDNYKFTISFADVDSVSSKRQHIFETSGNKNEIILPFWRAVKEFASHSYLEPHWPETYEGWIDQLTTMVKE